MEIFRDNNDDSKLTAGDTILLDHISALDAGMNVQIIKGSDVIGTIKELPP